MGHSGRSLTIMAYGESYKTELGVTFGMTPEEVQDIEARNNHELKGTYENDDSYQLYYEKDTQLFGLSCSRMEYDFDVVNHLLYQVYYVFGGGSADYAYLKDAVGSIYGDPVNDPEDQDTYSLLYDQLGRESSHIEASHWIIAETELGIDLWYNDYDTVFITFYDTSRPASYGAIPRYYSDSTGINFKHVDGWNANPFSAPPVMIAFNKQRDAANVMQYLQIDLWQSMKPYYEPLGKKREDYGADYLEETIVKALMQPIRIQNIRTEHYGAFDFWMFDYQLTESGASAGVYDCTGAVTLQNGYVHMFQLSTLPDKYEKCLPDFKKLLESVTIE